MNQNGLLVGSYWFTMYTAFFAVLSLVFYALETGAVSKEITSDATVGRQTLAILAKRSMAADRCTNSLTILFNQVSAKLQDSRTMPDMVPPSSKRSQPNSAPPNKPVTYPPVASAVNAQPSLAPRPPVDGVPTGRPNGAPWMDANALRDPTAPQQPALDGYHQNSFQPMPYTLPSSGPSQLNNSSHVSQVLFPSSDPFAYPNQPILSLDQNGMLNNSAPDASLRPPSEMAPNFGSDQYMEANMMGMHAEPSDISHHEYNHPRRPGYFTTTDGLGQQGQDLLAESADLEFPGVDFSDLFGGTWGNRMH
ncbi:MAG: hypothetical protein Q9162_006136 [Coniocarpon cinnabarinum]